MVGASVGLEVVVGATVFLKITGAGARVDVTGGLWVRISGSGVVVDRTIGCLWAVGTLMRAIGLAVRSGARVVVVVVSVLVSGSELISSSLAVFFSRAHRGTLDS